MRRRPLRLIPEYHARILVSSCIEKDCPVECQIASRSLVIPSEAKNLHWFASDRNCRSFASLRMTATFMSLDAPQVHVDSE